MTAAALRRILTGFPFHPPTTRRDAGETYQQLKSYHIARHPASEEPAAPQMNHAFCR
jgi:hypothetical protein